MSRRARARNRAAGPHEHRGAAAAASRGASTEVRIRIDDLVAEIDGARPGDRYAFAHAFEAELRRLLIENGVPTLMQTADRDRIAIAAVPPVGNAVSEHGRGAAAAVYGALAGAAGRAPRVPAAPASRHGE